ncbi:MAG TPA: peptidoglycan DD-metalloendopeptidase family protein [Burkholderiaceae bacterium]|nr:peptidoglycan DD-metalloendopeptidase family protein [Burkholderiaceae bacterium]
MLVVALGLFVTAAALAVVNPDSHDALPNLYQARAELALPDPFPQPSQHFSSPFVHQTRIRRGDTLAALLSRLDVREPGLLKFLTHDKDARSIYKLYPGRLMEAGVDENGALSWLRYDHTPGAEENGQYVAKWLEVRPDEKGGFTAVERTEDADVRMRVAEGEIHSSLFGATDAAGIPDAITLQMANILDSKIDFIKDLRKGDRFQIVYQSYSHNGQDVGAGRILALEFVNDSHTYQAVWFQPKNGTGGYYDFSGRSLKGAFLRTAIAFTRISSTFGMRMHPLHKKWTKHEGVDYAAPSGTPIHATADGVVKFIGQQRGYGNIIILQHPHDYSTVYAHQSRFASGLRKGDHVKQGQVIGYVGATGWATGPHLHYEFRIDNKPVNPLSASLPVAFKLDGGELAAFQRTTSSYKGQIAMLADLQDHHIQVASR